MMMKVAAASMILLSLLAIIIVTPSLAAVVDNDHHNPSVAVRLIVNRGRSIDPVCTSADQAAIVQASQQKMSITDSIITAATVTGSSSSSVSSPSWCRIYCTDFDRSSCWLAHPACGADNNNDGSMLAEYAGGEQQQPLGMLSEMELLVPDLNDNNEPYGDFSPALRASCLAQRTTVLEAVQFLVLPPHVVDHPAVVIVSSDCRMALQQKRIIADCVLIPGDDGASVIVVE
jgi:hypothetical protein